MIQRVAKAACQARGFGFECFVGEGAFKETFRVRDRSESLLALKIYRSGASQQRTDREIEAITRCEHPNIVAFKTLESQEISGNSYLVSTEEFLGGGTLADRLLGGILPVSRVIALAHTLVSAVVHIASHMLVHRDLKPDNIMFRDQSWTPVIVDFGLVRDLGRSSLTNSWVMRGPGTPLFAAPEQLNNEKALIDWRTDQFSLGVVLAYSAFGRHPYEDEGMDTAQIIDRVADRSRVSNSFLEAVAEAQLHPLLKMVAPFPITRYRRPNQLIRSWGELAS